jgi:2-oxo-4-hydroxy-4-carboxy-5-ureidoimidazoline decarboxylase
MNDAPQTDARGDEILTRWNFLPADAALNEILPCCSSRRWAQGVVARRPVMNSESLYAIADEVWRGLPEEDWLEAFRSHPRIGESRAPVDADKQSVAWSEQEQRRVIDEDDSVKQSLVEANCEYEKRFGRVFIVCATRKSVVEILDILRGRLKNDDHAELAEVAEQQRQIAQIRLRKWLGEQEIETGNP